MAGTPAAIVPGTATDAASAMHPDPRASRYAFAAVLLLLAGTALADSDGDRPVTAKVGGRLHWDIARFDNDARGTPNADDADLRAAWLDVSGRFYGLGYKLEADFAGDEVLARDVYLTRKFAAGTLTLGQFKQYVTLDDRVSSNHTVFVERSYLAQALAPTYRLGAAWLSARDGYTLGGGVYSLESIDVWQTRGRAAAVRASHAPWREAGHVLHVGVSAAREDYDHPGAGGAAALRVRVRPAGVFSDNSRLTVLDFAGGRDTRVSKVSLELAGVNGAFSYQGEAAVARYADGQQTGRLTAAYLQAAWMLTGEIRPYDAKHGRFGRIQPAARGGAWEVALRYDTLGGRQRVDGGPTQRDRAVDAWTAGVNWYPRPHLRLMLDYTDSRSRDRQLGTVLDRTRALAGRLQVDF